MRKPVLGVAVTVLCAGPIVRPAAGQFCTPRWSDRFPGAGVGDGGVACVALVEHDVPGSLQRGLYVGGGFSTAGPVRAGSIARWDGASWSALGEGIQTQGVGEVYAMAVFDDDGPGPHAPELYVGGDFARIEGRTSSHIAKWDGKTWSPVGSHFEYSSGVSALLVFDEDGPGPGLPVLMAAGGFGRVSRWDGQTWTTIGAGLPSQVSSLTAFDFTGTNPEHPSLVAGRYSGSGASSALSIWDGSVWTSFSAISKVSAMAVFDEDGQGPMAPALFVASEFSGLWRVAPGGAFSPVGEGLGSSAGIYSLTVWDEDGQEPGGPALYVGGSSLAVEGHGSFGVAKWDGARWSPSTECDVVYALVGDSGTLVPGTPQLFAGGLFFRIGGVDAPSIACWDGLSWESLDRPAGGLTGSARAVVSFPPFPGASREAAVVGGSFRRAGAADVSNIALWDSGRWSPMDGGLTDPAPLNAKVMAMVRWDRKGADPILCVGGQFTAAGGVPVHNVAAWDGVRWSAMGDCPIYTMALAIYDPDAEGPAPEVVVAAGYAEQPGFNGVAAWDGAQWAAMGSGVGSGVEFLAVYDEDGAGPRPPCLFAAGTFRRTGGGPFDRIARWDGTAWSALPYGPDFVTSPNAMTVFHPSNGSPKLYLGGGFGSVNGLPANGLATWDGSAWSPILIASLSPHSRSVLGLLSAREGDQAELYITGQFSTSQYHDCGVIRWDGTTGTLLNQEGLYARSLAQVDEDGAGPLPPALYAAGWFSVVGGAPSSNIARFGCDPCYANCDGSTGVPALGVNDFVCFQNLYAAGSPGANCDGSTSPPVLNVGDFVCFLNAYLAGCP